MAPAGVPAAIRRRLNEEVRKAVAKAEVQQLFAKNAITSGVLAPDASQRIVNEDYERMRELVRKSGATAN